MLKIKKQRLYSSLNIFAAIQLHVGLACLGLSIATLVKDRADFPVIEEEKSTAVKYIILGLDIGAVVSSAWFLFVGIIPIYMSCMSRSVVRTKVTFMVCCIMAASLFVPLVLGAAVTGVFLRGRYEAKVLALPGILAAVALVEMIFAISASIYCCRSPWSEHKHSDVEDGKKELNEEEKKMKKEEKKRQKEEKKKEKKEKKTEEKEKKTKTKRKEKDENKDSKILVEDGNYTENEVPPSYKL